MQLAADVRATLINENVYNLGRRLTNGPMSYDLDAAASRFIRHVRKYGNVKGFTRLVLD